MSEYIFYTFEGFTQSPNGTEVNNFQILGFEKEKDEQKALELFFKNNSWIIEAGFSRDNILIKRIEC